MLVSREFADKNPEAVIRYVATLIDLAGLITNNPGEAARLAAQEISKKGVPTEVKGLQLALTRIKMDPKVTDALLSELGPIAVPMHAAGKIASVPDIKKLVRYDFYDAALELSTAGNRAR